MLKKYEEVCEEFKSNGIIPMQMGAKDGWPEALFYCSTEINERDDITADPFLDIYGTIAPGLEKFKLLWTNEYIDNASLGLDYATVEANFAAGKFPIYVGLTFFLGSIQALNPEFTFDLGITPFNESGKSVKFCTYYDPMWTINSETKNPDISKAWIQSFMDNYDAFIEVAKFMPVKDVVVDDPFLTKEGK